MKVFFIRHGETTANANRMMAGQSDVLLTEKGKEQARAIASVLAPFTFDRVYSSDLSRAIETQKLALPDRDAIQTPLLREYDVGNLVGKPINSAKTATEEGGRDYSPFGGESTEMICDRVRSFFKILEEDPCQCCAVFAHNGIMNAALSVVLNAKIRIGSTFTKNCGIHVFEYENGNWKLLSWNFGASV